MFVFSSFRSVLLAESILFHLVCRQTIDHCIVANAEFLEDIASFAKANGVLSLDNSEITSLSLSTSKPNNNDNNASTTSHTHSHSHSLLKPKITENEMDKLRSTLRQLHRDWSEEGAVERNKCYTPIIEALEAHRKRFHEGKLMKVLVPG